MSGARILRVARNARALGLPAAKEKDTMVIKRIEPLSLGKVAGALYAAE